MTLPPNIVLRDIDWSKPTGTYEAAAAQPNEAVEAADVATRWLFDTGASRDMVPKIADEFLLAMG